MFTPNERARLQARSHCAAETIRRYPDVREASRLRIEAAAREEGIAIKTSGALNAEPMTGSEETSG